MIKRLIIFVSLFLTTQQCIEEQKNDAEHSDWIQGNRAIDSTPLEKRPIEVQSVLGFADSTIQNELQKQVGTVFLVCFGEVNAAFASDAKMTFIRRYALWVVPKEQQCKPKTPLDKLIKSNQAIVLAGSEREGASPAALFLNRFAQTGSNDREKLEKLAALVDPNSRLAEICQTDGVTRDCRLIIKGGTVATNYVSKQGDSVKISNQGQAVPPRLMIQKR